MNAPSQAPDGLVLRCRLDGTVTAVVDDGVGTGVRAGSLLGELLAPGNVESGLWLITEVADGRSGGLWDLRVLTASGASRSLRFVGCADGGDGEHREVLLAGAADASDLEVVLQRIAAELPEVAGCIDRLHTDAADPDDDPDRATLLAFSEANNELMAMHRELARKSAELETLNRRKDEILAMVAHDLRNPLGSIAGFGLALQRQLDGVVDGRARLMLERITALSEYLLALVEDLLDASAIDSGSLHLDLVDTDLTALLEGAVESHRYTASRKGMQLRLVMRPDGDGGPIRAVVDEHRLMQVVDNLLSNAIKYSPVSAGVTITVTCEVDGDHVRLVVADEGPGLTPEDIEGLFEPFRRGSNLTTAGERSAGLGLAITRSIVDAHRGSIEVASEVGQGATFAVRLPRSSTIPGASGSPG